MLLYLDFSPLDAFAINPILNFGIFNANLTLLTNLGLYLVIALIFIYLLFGNSVASHNASSTNTINNNLVGSSPKLNQPISPSANLVSQRGASNTALFAFSSNKATFTDQLFNYFNLMLQEASVLRNTNKASTETSTTGHLDHAYNLAINNLNLSKALKAAKTNQTSSTSNDSKALSISFNNKSQSTAAAKSNSSQKVKDTKNDSKSK